MLHLKVRALLFTSAHGSNLGWSPSCRVNRSDVGKFVG